MYQKYRIFYMFRCIWVVKYIKENGVLDGSVEKTIIKRNLN